MTKQWWKDSVVYQIYPRSFMDSNGDGIGDLQGIISKLDYLKELGVDVVWLCPVYESPNDDNGYDISHYQSIMKDFGTLSDWEGLLQGLHDRGMKLIMDLVVNHSSDEHAWFVESRKSKDNPYRDYYIWRSGENGHAPNDWGSFFSGSAWQYDENTNEYFLHLFSKKQPDLNWENPKLRQEIYDMMTWWLDKGIDGFRMDVINLISKVPELPPVVPGDTENYRFGGEYFMNGPRVHEYLQEMNREVLSKYDIMTVGEAIGVTPEEAAMYVGEERNELNMVFHFELMEVDSGEHGKWDCRPWKLSDIKRIIQKWQVELQDKGWNSLYLNNHDQPRMLSRFGNDTTYHSESAKMLATLLHTLQGTPYIYQGEELGMTNVKFDSIKDYKDIETLNMYQEYRAAGKDEASIMNSIYIKGRDNGRTPMQWNASAHGGFTTGTPWIAVNPNYTHINAEQAVNDPNSIFHYYRKLIGLRKEHNVTGYSNYRPLMEEDKHIFAYIRTRGNEQLLVVLNFFSEEAHFLLEDSVQYASKSLLISNYPVDENEDIREISLRPYEARVYKLQS
ncbi:MULTISPECIES: glycoside hydrolase family 13 protein [Paenibacillus]|uniref:glycoside hydrolase family 13 protein n=1 Tax=Paenibacillus TaxID=44249 RepID=UPI0022B92B90|nr:alpha-glucosidase [Paenibacillus caseinilyticus]MCZ8518302.1 alpha-glucosidase [Paenibacillus caseinilyticus]